MAKMTNKELVEKLKDIAKNYKTLYVMGCIGAPMTTANKTRYTQNHTYNKQASRTAMIRAASADTFGFDCVCLIKSVLWGWNGDKTKTYGGAIYDPKVVPDINADAMIGVCSGVSSDFSNIEVGEAVWLEGHIGVYIGDGLVVECTPIWKNGVQITACNAAKKGYHQRNWKKHGKLPYVTYGAAKPVAKPTAKENIPDVSLRVYTSQKRYLPWVKNNNDYAGNLGYPIQGVQCGLSSGVIKYRVKSVGQKNYYGWVSNYGTGSDGYAGVYGRNIDAVQMLCSDVRYKVVYRVHLLNGGWLDWVTDYGNGSDGYAGIHGKAIDAIEVKIEKR